LAVGRVVRELLALFARHDIHATWAVVGFTLFGNIRELVSALPRRTPAYADATLDPYRALSRIGQGEHDEALYFAPGLIDRTASSPHQGIGTHTFSHYYCLEPGQSVEDFRAALEAARAATIAKTGAPPRSLVFPRNQFNDSYLDACRSSG